MVVVGVLVLLNIIVIVVAVRNAHTVDDDFDLYNEDGDHIYYDRKLIRYKQQQNESYNSRETQRS